ncbi:hypothetical protein [Natrinema salinisoli]|uniref:hypothetical protein n=1 Tax=Natrinema salinisoli TaxID=2878535 RepID=UPI001CF077F7|nr:hypothetical protein [Natrinema salinisoli]
MTLKSLDQLLKDYNLTPENAKQYVCRGLAYNIREIKKDTGISRNTLHRYKRRFRTMEEETRLRLIAMLAVELHNEIADADLEVVEQ